MKNEIGNRIEQSWNKNASNWTKAIRSDSLESRRLVTNRAIFDTVVNSGGLRILDVGCGEGWLSHKLMGAGRNAVGFDGSSKLILQARRGGPGTFLTLSYEQFISDPDSVGHDFDIAVCNFSLLGETLTALLDSLHKCIKPSGKLLIQTVHPLTVSDGLPYRNGWREEKFEGLPGNWSSMPWYFRTFGSWMRELKSAGWQINECIEPEHPVTGIPASLILDAGSVL